MASLHGHHHDDFAIMSSSIKQNETNMKKATSTFLALLMLFAACKKDKAEPSLQGKWTLDNILVKEYMNGTLADTETEPGEGTTWEFKSDGHVIMTDVGSSPETHFYTIQAGSKVTIDGFVFDIQNLTATSVSLYIRQDGATGEYAEAWTNLRR